MFSRIREELEIGKPRQEGCLLGNVSAGSRIDAVLIRSNSIIVIELKDYSRAIAGFENGNWYCPTSSGAVEIDKGRENPYFKVRKYRGNVVDKIWKGSIRLGMARAKDLEDR